ncbi:MAG: hypothetical protein WAM39_01360 [Bryobacteraceae bacterium]
MATAQTARTSAGKRFTIVCDGAQDQFEVVECGDGAEGIAKLNENYPPGAGWMIVDSANTREEANLKLAEHRAEARRDSE